MSTAVEKTMAAYRLERKHLKANDKQVATGLSFIRNTKCNSILCGIKVVHQSR